MKISISIALFFILNFSFSQVEIKYSTVFENGTRIVNDLSYSLTIEMDSIGIATSFSFQEVIQDSINSNTMVLTIIKTQPIFKDGHIGVLYHTYNKEKVAYFIYMMDDYCVINYLPEGKSKFSESKTLFTLMSGKQ